jgi:murein DD-endopeptidase MepM/ murein hydrolase activator NlpD
MCLINRRAEARRGFACILAIALCLVPVFTGVRAQETPAGGAATIASAGEPVLLREQPGYDAAVLATLSNGNSLDVAGAPETAADGTSWLPVIAGGQSGYVPAGYVLAAPVQMAPTVASESAQESVTEPSAEPIAASSMTSESAPAPAPDPVAVAPDASGAATTTEANLRSGPSTDANILAVLAPGTSVLVDGAPSNGFVPVSANGVSGWINVELLTEGAASTTPLPAAVPATALVPEPVDTPTQNPTAPLSPKSSPEAARKESTGIAWPIAGGEWKVVQGYNTGTHTNRSGFAQYKYSLDWARVDGDTAGQPVFAPVSGTVQWVDRGSGGMLVDAGNGYGVAVFHVTLDRDLARGATVERGQRIGTISGPGGEGYMSMAHVDITVWRLTGGGHESVPFVGPNAIAGQEFPDSGGANQHMGTTVTP